MSSQSLARIALDFIDETITARDAAAIQELLLEHCRDLGFNHLIICDLPEPGCSSFDIQLCTWPQAFLDRFHKVHHKHDPIVRHARQTVEPFSWSEVRWDRGRGSPEQRVMDEAAEYQLVDGFVVPVVGVEGDQSCLEVSGRGSLLQGRDRHALHLMCLYAHHAVRRRRRAAPAAVVRSRLVPAQRDCLSYAFLGLDAETIADRMRLSSAEVSAVSRHAARSLGLAKPVEAAARAAALGEISP